VGKYDAFIYIGVHLVNIQDPNIEIFAWNLVNEGKNEYLTSYSASSFHEYTLVLDYCGSAYCQDPNIEISI
jgi:hypothetical protein